MAIFTIAGLTVTEMSRRKTLLGALVMGLLLFGLSLLFLLIRSNLDHTVATGHRTAQQVALQLPLVRSSITTLCLSAIKVMSALFAALLAGGAVSGEIERGLLAVILTRPISRWQILLGKWIGINVILVGCTLCWTATVWASLTLQTQMNLTPILYAGAGLALFPILVSTLSLTISTIAPRLFGTIFALTIAAFAWLDGIFNSLGAFYDVTALHTLANAAGLMLPQAYVGYWVESAMSDIVITGSMGQAIGVSPRFLTEYGARHLHFARLDALYVAAYILVVLLVGGVLFQRRDVA